MCDPVFFFGEEGSFIHRNVWDVAATIGGGLLSTTYEYFWTHIYDLLYVILVGAGSVPATAVVGSLSSVAIAHHFAFAQMASINQSHFE